MAYETTRQLSRDAADIIETPVDPAVSYRVLKKTLEASTATMKLRQSRRSIEENLPEEQPNVVTRIPYDVRASLAEKFAFAMDFDRTYAPRSSYAALDHSICTSYATRVAHRASALFRMGSSDAIDVAAAMMMHSTRASIGMAPDSREMSEGTKFEYLKAVAQPRAASSDDEALGWMLGADIWLTQPDEKDSRRGQVSKLLEKSPAARREWLRRLRSYVQMPDRMVASAFIRQGWRTMAGMGAPGGDRALSDVIGCDTLRQELSQLSVDMERGRDARIEAKELEIMQRVFGAVLAFPYQSDKEQKAESKKWKSIGTTPSRVLETKKLNCFTGPWLMAAMMLRSGIRSSQLFHCRIQNHSDNTWYATHGALLFVTRSKRMYIMDFGYMLGNDPIGPVFFDEERATQGLRDLTSGRRWMPVHGRIKEWATEVFSLPTELQVMQMADGYASGHMLSVGGDFLLKGQYDEAAHAFDLGLGFNPIDTDLTYYRGLTDFHRGDLASAADYFDATVRREPAHLMAQYSMGELAVEKKDYDEARRRFATVAADDRPVFGDDAFKKDSERFAAMRDAQLKHWWSRRPKRGQSVDKEN